MESMYANCINYKPASGDVGYARSGAVSNYRLHHLEMLAATPAAVNEICHNGNG